MIIALDYDQTYTADPELWNKFIQMFQEAGHTIVCVTGRREEMGDEPRKTIGKLIPIVFAGKDWKLDAAKAAGYDVDIWIDDNPGMISRQVLVGGGWSMD